MRQPDAALAGICLLAGLVEDHRRLVELVKQIPDDEQWRDVHELISREISRRETQGGRLQAGSSFNPVNHALSFLGWEWAD